MIQLRSLALSQAQAYGGAGNDSLTIGGAANTLTYEGGLGADTIKVGGAINSSTIYGDNASATEGGADSISIGWYGFRFLHLRQFR